MCHVFRDVAHEGNGGVLLEVVLLAIDCLAFGPKNAKALVHVIGRVQGNRENTTPLVSWESFLLEELAELLHEVGFNAEDVQRFQFLDEQWALRRACPRVSASLQAPFVSLEAYPTTEELNDLRAPRYAQRA